MNDQDILGIQMDIFTSELHKLKTFSFSSSYLGTNFQIINLWAKKGMARKRIIIFWAPQNLRPALTSRYYNNYLNNVFYNLF